MGFWIFMSLFNLLIPIIMLVAGYFMKNHPPVDINGIIGYRTRRSRKSKESWLYAQEYCGKVWLRVGRIITIVALIVDAVTISSSQDTIGWIGFWLEMAQCVVLLLTIIPVEMELKKKF